MVSSLEELKIAASNLPRPERAELAQYLLHTFDPAEEGADDEWLSMAIRRMEDVHAGLVTGIPAEEVMEGLRRSHG